MPARLNRRRYREAVAALKQIINDQKTPPARRLHAVELLLGVYDKHDRTEQKKEAQRRATNGPGQPTEPNTQDHELEDILERMQATRDEGTL